MFGAALDRPALVELTQQDLSGGPLSYGITLGLVGTRALAGAMLVGRTRLNPTQANFLGGIGMQAAGDFVIGISPWLGTSGGRPPRESVS